MVELTKVVKRKAGERWVAIYLTLKIIRKERKRTLFFFFFGFVSSFFIILSWRITRELSKSKGLCSLPPISSVSSFFLFFLLWFPSQIWLLWPLLLVLLFASLMLLALALSDAMLELPVLLLGQSRSDSSINLLPISTD